MLNIILMILLIISSFILGIVLSISFTADRFIAGNLYFDKDSDEMHIEFFEDREEALSREWLILKVIPHNTHVL